MSPSSLHGRDNVPVPTVEQTLDAASACRPALVLESMYYCEEPDLVAVMRAVAPLDPGARLQVLAYAMNLRRRAET